MSQTCSIFTILTWRLEQYKGEGNDDMRQDAVMEQVFDLVNVVLRHDRETTRRNLRMRGYKVIPLAAQAGVIEFVGSTMPLNHWFSPSHKEKGAHERRVAVSTTVSTDLIQDPSP